MAITAKVICASVSKGVKITSLEVVMPRIILAEWNTHRKFSRGTSSSRAISLTKMREAVVADPFIPPVLRHNRRGMSAGELLSDLDHHLATEAIEAHLRSAVRLHELLDNLDVHKQWSNRYLEPFMWSKVVVTATEWENFLSQRDHADAQPEMQTVAQAVKMALNNANHVCRKKHLPFISADDYDRSDAAWVSAFRCAAVSYTDPGQRFSWDEEAAKGRQLVQNSPPHWSPLEHVAWADSVYVTSNFDAPWVQFRKLYENK